MKKTSALWQWAGFALVTLGGTILHFLYDWSGKSPLIAPFSGVNESTWEHMKLLYWPLFLFSLIQRRFFKDRTDFWCVKLAQILTGLILIPVLFYTYNGAFGHSPDWVNIAIFYVAAGGAFFLEWWLFQRNFLGCSHPKLAFSLIVLTGILFIVFTFAPPPLPLFQPPA